MLGEILFGIVDNGVLIGSALIGFSLEDIINDWLFHLTRNKQYYIASRVKGLSYTILGAGMGNSISDFLGGLCMNWQMAVGSFLGCMLIVLVCLPLIFKLERR